MPRELTRYANDRVAGYPACQASYQQIKIRARQFGNRPAHVLSLRIVAHGRCAEDFQAGRFEPLDRLLALLFNNLAGCIHFAKTHETDFGL
jgi:hypothetical protein